MNKSETTEEELPPPPPVACWEIYEYANRADIDVEVGDYLEPRASYSDCYPSECCHIETIDAPIDFDCSNGNQTVRIITHGTCAPCPTDGSAFLPNENDSCV